MLHAPSERLFRWCNGVDGNVQSDSLLLSWSVNGAFHPLMGHITGLASSATA